MKVLLHQGLFTVCLFFISTALQAATITNTHDSLSRLTNAAYSDGSRESYSYDKAGNRLRRVTIVGVVDPDTIAPSTPANVIFSTNATGEIILSWLKSYDTGGSGMAGYFVYINGALFTNSLATNVILSGLVPNAAYCATIAAFDHSANISALTSSLCFQVPAINLSPNPALIVSIFPTPAPSPQSPNVVSFRSNAISFLTTGQNLSFDRQSSANFTLPSQIEPGDVIVSTTNMALWRGKLNPLPPFQDERGGYLRFALRVISQIAFNLDGVSWNWGASDPDDAFRYIDRLTNEAYQSGIQGLWYGPDGIKGTADDVWRNSGSGTNLVNELYYVGPGSSRLGNDQNQLDVAQSYINANLPLSFRCTFELFGTNGQLLVSTFREISTTNLTDKRIALLATNNAIDFGTISLGSTSIRSLIVSNAGTTPLNLQGVGFPFGFSATLANRTLSPGETTNISVIFAPNANVPYGGRLTVESAAASGNNSLPLYASILPVTSNTPTIDLAVFAMPAPRFPSPSFPAWRADVRRFLKNSYPLPTTRDSPKNFVLPLTFDAGDIMTATLTNITLWRGQLNPASPFAAERGVWTVFALRAVSAIPFNAAGVSWFIDCNVSGVMRAVGTNAFYGTGLSGLWYGPDGIKGTVDDAWRINGSITAPINEVYYTGAGNSFLANDNSQIAGITNYVKSHSPFSVFCTYTVRDLNGVILDTNTTSVLISPLLPATYSQLRLSMSGLSTTAIELQFNGMAGVVYQVQASTNLVNWQPIGTSSSDSDAFDFVDPQATNFMKRFYRLQVTP
jgi:hypothetical protein